MTSSVITVDPTLDLVLERDIDVPLELVWKVWTTPEHIRHWFVPKPWSIIGVEIDLRPGGAFNFTMQSPDGQEHPNTGSYLEVTPHERLIFTDTLIRGYRPSAKPFFTAVLELARLGDGTRYKAIAMHGNAETCQQHEQMGFHHGWGTVLTQMVDYIKAGNAAA